MKKLNITLLIWVATVSVTHAQGILPHDEYKEAISFLQGNGIYDRAVMRFSKECAIILLVILDRLYGMPKPWPVFSC